MKKSSLDISRTQHLLKHMAAGALFVLMLGSSVAPSITYAQATPATPVSPTPVTPAPAAPAATPTATAAGATTPAAASGTSTGGVIASIFGGVLNFAGNAAADIASAIIIGACFFILGFANFMLGIAGILLNWVVVKTVFQYASVFGNSAGLLVAWGILRDIGNIVLLFGFIFIGIATILDISNYTVKRALIGLLLFAAALNFSLFAAEAIIDVSNVLSSVMYTQADTSSTACAFSTGSAATADANCAINIGIAGHIMQSTGLSGMFSVVISNKDIKNQAAVFIGLAAFSIIGAVVLFATSVMLIIRAVVLTLLIVASPIGFAGMAVPPLKKFAERWWNMLLSQAFFAPVLLLLIFVSLKISDSFVAGTSIATTATDKTAFATTGLAGALAAQNPNDMGIILVFVLVIGFLVASLMAAKSMGAVGATFAVNTASALTLGAVTRGSNLTLGGGSRVARYIQQRTGVGGQAGQVVVNRLLRPLEGANLDLRRAGLGGILGAAGATTGAKPAEKHSTFNDIKHLYTDARDGKQSRELEDQYNREVAVANLERQAHQDDHAPAGAAATFTPDSERALLGMNTEQLEALHGIKEASATLARNLTPDQFGKLMDGKGLNDREKQNLANARFRATSAAVAPVGGAAPAYDNNVRDTVRRMSAKDLEQLAKYDATSYQNLLNVYDPATGEGYLSGPQFDKMVDSNSLTNGQRQSTRENSKRGRIETAVTGGNHALAQTYAATLNSKDKAKLNGNTLTSPGVIATYTPGDLAEIQREGKLDPVQVNTIATAVTAAGHPNQGAINTWIRGKADARAYWR